MKLVVDLDDTLINTTSLNNDAYNFALEYFGYSRITTKDRLTRDSLSFLSNNELKTIIDLKQYYFTRNWLPYRVLVNHELLKIISNNKDDCFLWTKADNYRANKILELCGLRKYFKSVIFDEKISFESSTNLLKDNINAENLIVYENNHKFFENKNVKLINEIRNQFFDVRGYIIKNF